MSNENQIGTVHAADFEMEYCRFGTGSRALVIIPGLSLKSVLLSASIVAAGYKDFTSDFTVYLFDRKKNVTQGYSLQEMARDQALAMKSLGIEKADVFGTSQGGMVAQYMAIAYPEMVHKLVLGSSTSKAEPLQLEVIGSWAQMAAAGDADKLVQSFIENAFTDSFAKRYERALRAMYKDISAEEMNRFAILAKACEFVNTLDELGKIKCPVFVIGATEDHVVTGDASKKIFAKLKEENVPCELYMYEGYGHAVYDEAKDYKKRILQFLKR